jgi:isoquinoline 1-oxidoreductase beta subunit
VSEHNLSFSRREVLLGGAGLMLGVLPGGDILGAQTPGVEASDSVDHNAYVRIGTDNSVTVIVKHLEFGQGPLTGLATLVAEELDADWAQVRAHSAPANAKLYGNVRLGGMQATGGSSSIASSYDLMRRAGATARAMLVLAAAQSWGVSPEEIVVKKGLISHSSSRRNGRFGQFATAAAKLPVPQSVSLKNPGMFALIGREGTTRRLDTAAKVNGSARYTIDITEPGMLTVVVARPRRFGARPGKVDTAAALRVKGVVAVRPISNGYAVYATGMWPALKGRKALTVTWDESAAEKRSSEEMITEYLELTRSPGTIVGQKGDVEASRGAGGELVEASYVFPYLAHAPMEPLDGYLRWNGDSATARYGCQMQTPDQGAIAKVLGLPADKVNIETMLAGGSFGRRAQASLHFPIEMAEVAKAIGPDRPVKLIWTREDDIQGGSYRPLFVHRLRGVIRNGEIVAWSNSIAGQSFMTGTPFEAWLKNGIDPMMSEGASELLYEIDNFRCDVHRLPSPVTTNSWRSVGHTHTAYAVECFMDELLDRTGSDPLSGRLKLLRNEPRAAAVLKAVAERANWKGPRVANGRARGVALVKSFNTFVAQIAEVSVGENGEPKVHKIWCAVDCGVVVNPDVVRAQMEGGIGYAIGHALYAEVPIQAGAATVSNFHDYRSLTMEQMPEVEVIMMRSPEPPAGVGEPGVPPVAPAIANALARLTGSRPARLPMVRAV